MADRTYVWATVYACPEDNLAPAAAAILDAGIVQDGPTIPEGASNGAAIVTLGQHYSDPEVVFGTAQDLASALLQLGCTFETGEDPRYEYSGELWRGAPALGIHVAASDGHHNLYVAHHHIDQAIHTTHSREALTERLHDLLGTRWQEAIDCLKPQEAS